MDEPLNPFDTYVIAFCQSSSTIHFPKKILSEILKLSLISKACSFKSGPKRTTKILIRSDISTYACCFEITYYCPHLH